MFTIGILIFPQVQPLDVCGPFEVFAMSKECSVKLVWKSLNPVHGVSGMSLIPHQTIYDCGKLDVLVVPGGSGINNLLLDIEITDWIKHQATTVSYLTSVCTGALLLGTSGLLAGKRATTHWNSLDLLKTFGAIPAAPSARVVRDGSLITAGGVTAGIDFGLTVLSELLGQDHAEVIQLFLEYAPCPPFTAGHPGIARPAIVAQAKELGQASRTKREGLLATWTEQQMNGNDKEKDPALIFKFTDNI